MLFDVTRRSVVVLEPYGRNSNRLLQNLHFHAYCLDKGFEYANPTLAELRPLLRDPAPVWPGGANRPPPRGYFSLAWRGVFGPVVHFANDDVAFPPLEDFRFFRRVFVSGWHFRVPERVRAHRDELRRRYDLQPRLFAEDPDYRALRKLRASAPTLGVHVRRGDYREWRGGRYYYDDSVYDDAVERVSTQIRERHGTPPKVVVFSDEPLTLAHRSALPSRARPWYLDQKLMSECDYLMGPPSTFSIWASFIGGARLVHLQSADHRPELAEFSAWPRHES